MINDKCMLVGKTAAQQIDTSVKRNICEWHLNGFQTSTLRSQHFPSSSNLSWVVLLFQNIFSWTCQKHFAQNKWLNALCGLRNFGNNGTCSINIHFIIMPTDDKIRCKAILTSWPITSYHYCSIIVTWIYHDPLFWYQIEKIFVILKGISLLYMKSLESVSKDDILFYHPEFMC